jgi:hypothetical protein
VSSKSDLMLSQFALSYLRIFLGCWRTLHSHMSRANSWSHPSNQSIYHQ